MQGSVTITQDSEAEEAPGILTPFTLSSLVSQLRIPLKGSPPKTTIPSVLNEPRSTQAGNTRRRDDLEGRDTLVEVVEVMRRFQERLAHLEERSSGERAWERRLQRTSSPNQSEATFRSEGTSDPPPTYKS
jgi:hypothetical protein